MEKKKYFVLSDIHSFYTPMMKALSEKGFDINNPLHYIILCGDMMDRGDESMETLNFFYDLYKKNRFIFIRGNHEDLFVDMIRRGYSKYHDVLNGTEKTLLDLSNIKEVYPYADVMNAYDRRWDELIFNSIDYYELGNYIFVHGWIPVKEEMPEVDIALDAYDYTTEPNILYDPDWRNASQEEWKKARWCNGMKYAIVDKIIIPDKIIVCGHWHTSYGHVYKKNMQSNRALEFADDADFSVFRDTGIIALDACTAHTRLCNCIIIEEQEDGTYKEDSVTNPIFFFC